MRKKEIYWLFGTGVLVLILVIFVFGFDRFRADTTLDINIHDTFYVIDNIFAVLLTAVPVFFTVYLFRSLGSRFQNLTANLILMISTILLLLVLIWIRSITETFIELNDGWTIYPPLSAGGSIEQYEQEMETKDNTPTIISNVILALQLLLMIFLAYCGFKTGRNYKPSK